MIQLREPDAPWCVVGNGVFKCLRCGKTESPRLPVPIDAYVCYIYAFVFTHEHCKEPQKEADERA